MTETSKKRPRPKPARDLAEELTEVRGELDWLKRQVEALNEAARRARAH